VPRKVVPTLAVGVPPSCGAGVWRGAAGVAVPQWAASGTPLVFCARPHFSKKRFRSLPVTPCCSEQSWAWVCGARPGWLPEPEAALLCPCADAGGLGLPSLKNSKRVSKGDLSKEDLAWPLALAGAQEVSAHPGCSQAVLPGALGAVCGGTWCPGPRPGPSPVPLRGSSLAWRQGNRPVADAVFIYKRNICFQF